MSIMLKLCNFGTIYLWIFVLRVIQVCADPRMGDGGGGVEGGGGGGGDGEDVDADKRLNSLIKPYPYQMFHYMDDLLRRYHQENGLRPIPAKVEQHPAHQPLGAIENLPWKSGSEFEIDLKNLNDFDIYKMANAIWPIRKFRQEDREWQQKVPSKQQQHQLRHRFPLPALLSAPTNILYTASNDGDDKGNRRSQQNSNNNKAIKTSWLKALGSNGDDDDDNDDDYTNDPLKRINDIAAKGYGKVSMQVFPPLTVDKTSNMKRTNAMNSNPDPENGNENFNYSNNDDTVSDNYPEDANLNADKNGNVKSSVDASSAPRKRGGRTRDKKPKQNLTTPFLPAISGGSMVNLGKFFRDLSKNLQFSEKYQWSSEEQKLLEGDPTFGDLHHHLHDPEGNTDQAAEWIKAIRFYRPSQKIRSLVEMNPHGQWAHGSNFIDPNYMWIGLGK
ncbi:uncharacterized protein LOC131803683 [Musca domestica]|uniref:Uncharacterized protein LOC131803683 n=2 Tax=Musca domestica TaxID=7370 RepID=A0ABM3V603_MUSDO|nr:uncharacterized protein LOC131803683 [Musca domestica]